MLRLLTAALAVALFVLPALADDPPAGMACVSLPSWFAALEHSGQTVLAVAPAPFTVQPVLYWRTPGGLVIMAPVGPAADGSGPCVAYQRAVPLGMYRLGQTS